MSTAPDRHTLHLQRMSCARLVSLRPPAWRKMQPIAPPGRSGFTREYGSGGNGERRVEIGQQAWPLRG
ncbi:hypothetical protein C5609_12760 [Pseudomonas putida]|nr:hypothetical protein C5609_12760 [Pseudomonas putida]